jgi:hypothetical protein
MPAPGGLGEHPFADLPGRVVPHMLRVATLELGDPVPFVILPEPDDSSIHSPSTMRGRPRDAVAEPVPGSNLGRLGRLCPVGRAPHAECPAIQDMGVNHGRADVVVAKEFLDGPDVVSVFQQVGGERVTKAVAGGPLGNSG